MTHTLTHRDIRRLAEQAAATINDQLGNPETGAFACYAVPRGGIPAFYAIQAAFSDWGAFNGSTATLYAVETPHTASVIIDDLVDSGATFAKLKQDFPQKIYAALITKGVTQGYPLGDWLVFPWEGSTTGSIEDAVTRLLQFVGEDPTRGGLLETPARFAKAWKEYTSGYEVNVTGLLKTFEDGAEGYNEMITQLRIPFCSHCEHHLAPFSGHVCFGYIPQGRVVGLSKMNRLVDAFSRRLQVQERMTTQILNAFVDAIKPLGAGIRVTATHGCIECRGVRHTGCSTVTTGFAGVLMEPTARNEFLLITQP